jgi:hypothetical protein
MLVRAETEVVEMNHNYERQQRQSTCNATEQCDHNAVAVV